MVFGLCLKGGILKIKYATNENIYLNTGQSVEYVEELIIVIDPKEKVIKLTSNVKVRNCQSLNQHSLHGKNSDELISVLTERRKELSQYQLT